MPHEQNSLFRAASFIQWRFSWLLVIGRAILCRWLIAFGWKSRIFGFMLCWWRTFTYTYGVLVPQACVTTLPSRSHPCATSVCHNLAKPSVTTLPSYLSQVCQAICHKCAKLSVTPVPSCWHNYAASVAWNGAQAGEVTYTEIVIPISGWLLNGCYI